MKEFLVDVPVKVGIWIRPDCQKKQFDILRKARPSILFLISDQGRDERERRLVGHSRRIFDNIDWECTVYKLYEEENQGMYAMIRKTHEMVWNYVDRCIFLEDDILPSVSYFQFCAQLLERYKDDLRVNVICGMNQLGVYKEATSDYIFSRQGSIWGVAMWKRTYEQHKDFSYGKDAYVMGLLKERTRKNQICWRRIAGYADREYYEGHVAADEFWIEMDMYAQNQLQIVPRKNMIKNIGCREDSAHSDGLKKMPRGIWRVFHMRTYEIGFPLKHNDYVIPDVAYEKKRNRIMAYNHPGVVWWRRIEIILRKARYGDLRGILNMADRRLRKICRKEKHER